MSRYQMVISERAEKGLLQHISFLARVSKRAAQKMKQEYMSVAQEIKCNPFHYPLDDSRTLQEKGYHKALFGKRYKILFKVENKTVYLDAVVDCRMDPDREWDL